MEQAEQAATVGSWIAVGIICGGTVVGGIALIEWLWPMFWVGVAMFIGGGLLGWRTNIMGSVSEWSAPDTSSRR
jgi:hypothetical protein